MTILKSEQLWKAVRELEAEMDCEELLIVTEIRNLREDDPLERFPQPRT